MLTMHTIYVNRRIDCVHLGFLKIIIFFLNEKVTLTVNKRTDDCIYIYIYSINQYKFRVHSTP